MKTFITHLTMEFDTVIMVTSDGRITERPELNGPDYVYVDLDDTGSIPPGSERFHGLEDDWTPFTGGYSAQYCYHGAIMHSSEYIGGQLERDIRENPGYYVAVTVSGERPTECAECTERGTGCCSEHNTDRDFGWAVLYRPLEAEGGTE